MVRRLQTEQRRHVAAVKLQSQVRGYLQRVAYRRQLTEHRRTMTLMTGGTFACLPSTLMSWKFQPGTAAQKISKKVKLRPKSRALNTAPLYEATPSQER